MRRRGMILILSSPSGAGKTTLTRMLLQDKALDLTLSISVTTRPRRSSEADGIHYHFIDRHQFDLMKAAGDLLESAEVHGNCYGTPREPVEAVLAAGPRRAVRHRLAGRAAGARGAGRRRRQRLHPAAVDGGIARAGSSGAPRIRPRRSSKRLENAKREIERWRYYDYVVVNDDLQRAYARRSWRSSPPNARAARASRRASRGSSRSCWRGSGRLPP